MPIGSLFGGGAKKKAMRQMIAAQDRANKINQAIQASKAHQDRVAQLREARIKRAQVIAGASNAGIGLGSSGVSGAESSIGSQLAQNVGLLGESLAFSSQLGATNQAYAQGQYNLQKAQMKEQMWNTIGSTALQLGTAAAGAMGGAGGMTSLAGGNSFQGMAGGINTTSGNFTWK